MPAPEPEAIPVTRLTNVADDSLLSPVAKRQLRPGMPSDEFFHRLLKYDLYPDAVRYLAQCLPRREAVFWACLCVRHAGGEPLAGLQFPMVLADFAARHVKSGRRLTGQEKPNANCRP